MCPVQPVKEDQREYSLLLRWLGLALMVVSIKKKRLVGPVVVVDLTWSVVCVVFSPIRIIFRLSSPLAFISLFTRLVTFVHAYKIYCITKFCFILRFGVSILVCLVIRISDPLAHCFWVNCYAKTLLHEQIKQTMVWQIKTLEFLLNYSHYKNKSISKRYLNFYLSHKQSKSLRINLISCKVV